MRILILNGPNLNLQGRRDRAVYGAKIFDEFIPELRRAYPDIVIDYRQSNIEGELIDALHEADGRYDGVLLNAGGYTHTSVAIRDAVSAIDVPVVEIHISNIGAREEFRHTSLLAAAAAGSIIGFGLDSYRLGVEALRLRRLLRGRGAGARQRHTMADRLRDKVAMGVAWSVAEKIGSMLLQVAVSIIVARLLMPDDFGVMAIMTFFTALALVVVDSGFSQMLIRKNAPTADDYKSVFVFNVAVSIVLYVVLTLTAPMVARFYGRDVIARIAPVLFLLLPINAFCVIQNTIFTRRFRFDLLSKINFASSCIAGVIAIAMALAGMGVWALVGQRLGTMAAKAALLWLCSDWRADGAFSGATLRAMAPFSFRLMFTDIISAVYNNVAQLFIGKMYSTDTLGYFNQAQKLKELPVSSAMQSVQSVTYPALSNIKDDAAKFADSYRRVMMVTAFVMFPAMVGMIAVADDMFALLLGERGLERLLLFRDLRLQHAQVVDHALVSLHHLADEVHRAEQFLKARRLEKH